MWSNVIAVLGTLAGCLLTGGVQARVARIERREIRWEAHRTAALDAVTALVEALANHRTAMFVLEDRRLSGADADAVEEARQASHVTRTAVTNPLTRLCIVTPGLAKPARQAAKAAYAMRQSADADVLEARRRDAVEASDRLVEAAAELFAAVGGVVEVA
jgi:hypothetical protein